MLPYGKLSAKVWVYEARDSNVIERAEIYAKGDLSKTKKIEYYITAYNYRTGYTAIMNGQATKTPEHVEIYDSLWNGAYNARDFYFTTPNKCNSIITIRDSEHDLLRWGFFMIDDRNPIVFMGSRFISMPLTSIDDRKFDKKQIPFIRDAMIYSSISEGVDYRIELEDFTTMEKDSIGFIVSRRNKRTCFFDMIQGVAKKYSGTIPMEYGKESDGYITYLYKPIDSSELFIQIESGNYKTARFFSKKCAYSFDREIIKNDRVIKGKEEYYTSGVKLLKRKE